MSKTLSIRMYLKHQKKDAGGKVPVYVHVTIDGDDETFSLSRKVFPGDWNQTKQKCISKSQQAQSINTGIDKICGDLITLFDRFPIQEVVKAKQLIRLYHNQSSGEELIRRDARFHTYVLAIIEQYLALKTQEKRALRLAALPSQHEPFQEKFGQIVQSIEHVLTQSRV